MPKITKLNLSQSGPSYPMGPGPGPRPPSSRWPPNDKRVFN